MRRRLRNMRRLSCGASAYLYILHRYAEVLRANANGVQLKGAICRLAFEWRQRTKRKLKSIFRRDKTGSRRECGEVQMIRIPGRL